MTATRCGAVFAFALALGACQTGLGRVPGELVDLYDMGAPAGVIELEIGRDGTIHEMEADIPVEALPRAVRDAALREAPGAKITGAERELQESGSAWEVKLVHQGRGWELVIDDDGAVVETEKELTADQAPRAVLEGADRAVAEGTRKSVEVIERGATTEYHVKKQVGDASYKIVLAADGTVKRAVREARAEIEIPLR